MWDDFDHHILHIEHLQEPIHFLAF
jgi:hypothetical protein